MAQRAKLAAGSLGSCPSSIAWRPTWRQRHSKRWSSWTGASAGVAGLRTWPFYSFLDVFVQCLKAVLIFFYFYHILPHHLEIQTISTHSCFSFVLLGAGVTPHLTCHSALVQLLDETT
jgi:hypothetical protein